jgi:GTP cyclohydrolase I
MENKLNVTLQGIEKNTTKEYAINTFYDRVFIPSEEYLENMPDLQNGNLIKGAKVPIERVGISNFKLPLKIQRKDGGVNEIETSVVGTVSLEGVKKGINMSRILRSFYEYKDETFDIDKLPEILQHYRNTLGSYEAHLQLTFNYRIWQESLRSVKKDGSKNGGWQYYKITLESIMDKEGVCDNILHFDFVYSSTCPCSTELSLYAMDTREVYATPHSQRSVARISIKTDNTFWVEDLRDLCQDALQTETVVFCKREDEQAFAELNAANTKFVEDAVRLLYEKLNKVPEIKDFKVIASHNESLHSHDAISVITKGIEGGFNDLISVADLKSLIY